jgi:ubiquitin-protein ligase
MSEINIWTYELNDFIKKNNISNIVINSCLEEDNECELKLTIDNNNLQILSDFKNYCYIESSLYNTDKLNQYILFENKYKSLEVVIDTIIKFKFNEEIDNKVEYADKFHFYNLLEEKTKLKLDYIELDNIAKKYKSNNLINIKIPKELLLNINQINQLIITEIKNINSNHNYKHIIQPIDNNIYSLKLTLYLESTNVNIKINLNNKLYPFYPPEIELINPKIKLPLYFAIKNLNITKIKYWNSSMSLEWIILNLVNKLNPIIDIYIDDSQDINEIEELLLKLFNIIKEKYENELSIDFDIPNILPNKINNNELWKSGTGYNTYNNNNDWNINDYIKDKEFIQLEIYSILNRINNILNNDIFIIIKNSCLFKYIIDVTKGINLLEIENQYLIFNEIINILLTIKSFNDFKNINTNFIINIVENLKPINDEIMLLFHDNEELQNNELYQGLHNIYQTYSEIITPNIDNNIITNTSDVDIYCNIMKTLQFAMNDLLPTHRFYDNKNSKPNPTTMKRIISEISSLKLGLPLNYDSSIWIRISKTNMNIFTFMISGPKDTPYENGLFLFNAYLPNNYPQVEPKILLITTGNGSVRFNPNLYNCGKVCLSLLGTWSGNDSEKWNPKTSTFLQVLVSIQSLILIDQPFFNEPGYEKMINTINGKYKSKIYNYNIQYENIRWAMIDQINNPPYGYEDVIKNHFKLKKNDIINTIDKWNIEKDSEINKDMNNEILKLKELLNFL